MGAMKVLATILSLDDHAGHDEDDLVHTGGWVRGWHESGQHPVRIWMP